MKLYRCIKDIYSMSTVSKEWAEGALAAFDKPPEYDVDCWEEFDFKISVNDELSPEVIRKVMFAGIDKK